MALVVGVLLLAGAGYYLSGDGAAAPAPNKEEAEPVDKAPIGGHFPGGDNSFSGINMMNLRDYKEMGFPLGQFRPSLLNITQLNEAWKPYSAPMPTSTRSLMTVYADEAQKQAYLSTSAPYFWFLHDGEIPLNSAQQSNPNVEIPCRDTSFRGDPGNSLSYYPRVYADRSCAASSNPRPFQTKTSRVFNAGMPDEGFETKWDFVGRNPINAEWNPWGAGGALQRVFQYRQERETMREGVDRSVRTAPPPSQYFNNIYSKS